VNIPGQTGLEGIMLGELPRNILGDTKISESAELDNAYHSRHQNHENACNKSHLTRNASSSNKNEVSYRWWERAFITSIRNAPGGQLVPGTGWIAQPLRTM
jgi:hypothetical protein